MDLTFSNGASSHLDTQLSAENSIALKHVKPLGMQCTYLFSAIVGCIYMQIYIFFIFSVFCPHGIKSMTSVWLVPHSFALKWTTSLNNPQILGTVCFMYVQCILILGYCQSIPLHLKGIYTCVAHIHNSETNEVPLPKTLPTISMLFPWAQPPAAEYKAQVLVNLRQEMTEMMERGRVQVVRWTWHALSSPVGEYLRPGTWSLWSL